MLPYVGLYFLLVLVIGLRKFYSVLVYNYFACYGTKENWIKKSTVTTQIFYQVTGPSRFLAPLQTPPVAGRLTKVFPLKSPL